MSAFTSLLGPRVHIDQLDSTSLRARKVILSTPREAVRVLRGNKMLSDAALFDEVAAACQFPGYFGENWNALRDCLSDLQWMPADRYVFIIAAAEVMLAEAPDVLKHFVEAFNDVADQWSQAGIRPWAPEPRPFHLVLRTRVSADAFVPLLTETGVEFDRQSWPE